MPISDVAKLAIRQRANYLCEYCHSPERLSANRFTVDHIIPKRYPEDDSIRATRRFWIQTGLHPPATDPS